MSSGGHWTRAATKRMTKKGPARQITSGPAAAPAAPAQRGGGTAAAEAPASRVAAHAPESRHAIVARPKDDPGSGIVARGSGRGLRAVEEARETKTSKRRRDGTTVEVLATHREQKLYKVKGGGHVGTKAVTTEQRKIVQKDGTEVVTESTVKRKVSYC
mmetsp:Transcript_65208/g.121556  ORF Transcript_65208/g.121556 Transcript_65208/m.121556 type:complete len:159 (-) Transcript_65208:176-652(-)